MEKRAPLDEQLQMHMMSVTACFIYYLILNHFRQGLSLHSLFGVRYNQECLDQDYNSDRTEYKIYNLWVCVDIYMYKRYMYYW